MKNLKLNQYSIDYADDFLLDNSTFRRSNDYISKRITVGTTTNRINYPTDYNAFEMPDTKRNVKHELSQWKSMHENNWYGTNRIVNPYEKAPLESYRRANRLRLLELPSQRTLSVLKDYPGTESRNQNLGWNTSHSTNTLDDMIDRMRSYHYSSKLAERKSKEFRDNLFTQKFYQTPLEKYEVSKSEYLMTGEKNRNTIEKIASDLAKEYPNMSQTALDAKCFKMFKDTYVYDKMENIRQKAVRKEDVANDKYIMDIKAKTLGYAESNVKYYKKYNPEYVKLRKLKNDIKEVEELDRFMAEGTKKDNMSEEEF